MVDICDAVEEAFAPSAEVALMGFVLPERSNVARRVRVAFHLLLERADGLAQLLAELDGLGVWLAGHGDDEAGNMLLAVGDRIREEVADNA